MTSCCNSPCPSITAPHADGGTNIATDRLASLPETMGASERETTRALATGLLTLTNRRAVAQMGLLTMLHAVTRPAVCSMVDSYTGIAQMGVDAIKTWIDGGGDPMEAATKVASMLGGIGNDAIAQSAGPVAIPPAGPVPIDDKVTSYTARLKLPKGTTSDGVSVAVEGGKIRVMFRQDVYGKAAPPDAIFNLEVDADTTAITATVVKVKGGTELLIRCPRLPRVRTVKIDDPRRKAAVAVKPSARVPSPSTAASKAPAPSAGHAPAKQAANKAPVKAEN